ncbi:hypothetical protein AAN20_15615 [Salmonella enterica subsp. enterica serovar Havana]|nr:hypothetical protein [Salmonella enterica subsp. enterica]EBV7099638.1 hypothetical protein [Salmonella enterica subsp. enterica serovar Havana]EBX9530853.1 hypothetical protein [Salmonella enterica subsp. enterica serovar Havana]
MYIFIVQQTRTKKEPSGSFEKFYRLPLPGAAHALPPWHSLTAQIGAAHRFVRQQRITGIG